MLGLDRAFIFISILWGRVGLWFLLGGYIGLIGFGGSLRVLGSGV